MPNILELLGAVFLTLIIGVAAAWSMGYVKFKLSKTDEESSDE